MAIGNLPASSSLNNTTEYFNNFFSESYNVNQNVNDAVVGYFQSVTGDKASGTLLAAAVIYTAQTQGMDIMSLLDEFRKLKTQELSAYLAMLLNFNRVETSLLGISNSPPINKYIQRAILA
jgi:hypothetical protein